MVTSVTPAQKNKQREVDFFINDGWEYCVKKEFERTELTLWGKRFYLSCSYNLRVEVLCVIMITSDKSKHSTK
jgi:hypothetical protein